MDEFWSHQARVTEQPEFDPHGWFEFKNNNKNIYFMYDGLSRSQCEGHRT